MAVAPESIDAPYQIICEGRDDVEFFLRLLRDRNIAGYNVGFPKGADGRPLGKDRFDERIDQILAFATVPIRGIIVVADSDDDPAGRFADACEHFRGKVLPIPKAAMQERKSGTSGTPKTAVIMIPAHGVEGGLETLVLSCCAEVEEFRECINSFCLCVDTPRSILERDKLRLRALIAALNPKDPSASISNLLSTARRPFPMTHTALDGIAQFLIHFAAP